MRPLADEPTAEVIGVDDVRGALSPESPAGRRLAETLETYRPGQRPGWLREMKRTRATNRWARENEDQVPRAESVLGEVPQIDGVSQSLQQPEQRRDPLADVDLFRIKRFLYHGRQLLVNFPGLAAAQEVPVDPARKKFADLLGRLHPDGTDHPRFHLSDALNDELADVRRQRRDADDRLREVRGELEASVVEDYGGSFDIQGAWRPPEGEDERESVPDGGPGADPRLRHSAGAWRVWSDELEELRDRRDSLDVRIDDLEEACRGDLTEKLSEEVEWLDRMATHLAKADLRLAKARLIEDLDGCWPEWSEEDELAEGAASLEDARHPRIVRRADTVQPIDMRIGTRPIVVMGPNMGGKSALLRMVGLAQWCAQHALPVPADRYRFRPVESIVYVGSEEPHAADAEEGLSSFGREIHRIVEHMRRDEVPSLWLLDEVGRGTHPEDGADLAVSIVEALAARGHRVVAATHFPELAGLKSARNLRIKGLDESRDLDEALRRAAGDPDAVEAALRSAMDYQPEPADGSDVPRDARRVAEALGLDLT